MLSRHGNHDSEEGDDKNSLHPQTSRLSTQGLPHLARHQLYDAPMRASTDTVQSEDTVGPLSPGRRNVGLPVSPGLAKSPTIKFGTEDIAHFYPGPGNTGSAIHEQRAGHSAVPPGAMRPRTSPQGTAQSAPPTQMTYGGGGLYDDPYNSSADQWRSGTRSAGPSKQDTLPSLYHSDDAVDSAASLPTISSTHDQFESPPLGPSKPSGHRYPSRGDDDPLEHQRLVNRERGSSDSDNSDREMQPGGIRLLPKLP